MLHLAATGANKMTEIIPRLDKSTCPKWLEVNATSNKTRRGRSPPINRKFESFDVSPHVQVILAYTSSGEFGAHLLGTVETDVAEQMGDFVAWFLLGFSRSSWLEKLSSFSILPLYFW